MSVPIGCRVNGIRGPYLQIHGVLRLLVGVFRCAARVRADTKGNVRVCERAHGGCRTEAMYSSMLALCRALVWW